MAKVSGNDGGSCIAKAETLRWRRLLIALIVVALLGFVEGATLSSFWATLHTPSWLTNLVQYGGLAVIGVLVYWSFRKMDALWKSAANWKRGGEGETGVGRLLAKLPDDFHVIHDIQVPGQEANLDHVVVGPTGVYVLDAKNWRGLVTPDGKGELLLNNKPTPKPYLRQFIGRVMGIKEKVKVLAPGLDPFFQAVFVFTSAYVNAKWGTTGHVHCLTDEGLRDYIVEKGFGKRLSPDEVQRLAQAFRGLEQMDRDFTEKATATSADRPSLVRPVTAKA